MVKNNIILFLCIFILNFLFPFYGDDLAALEVKQQLSFFEGVKWWYHGSNPRVQNLLTLVFTTKNMLLHNIFSSLVFVMFVHTITRITKVSMCKVVVGLCLGICPAIWSDFYLAAPAFYNHFLGFNIGLITYLAYKENWKYKIFLLLLLTQTGVVISIPFLCLIFIQFKTWHILFGIIGFLIFYSFPGTHIRAIGDGISLNLNLTEAFNKLISAWEFWFLFCLINFTSKVKYNYWHLISIFSLLLISISPVKDIGLSRLAAIPLLFSIIGSLPYLQKRFKHLVLPIYFIFLIGLIRFNVTSYQVFDDALYNYTINLKYNLFSKQIFDRRAERGFIELKYKK